VAIFIIVGLMIVVSILTFMFLMRDGGDVLAPSDMGPRDFIVDCVGDIVADSAVQIMRNGGEVFPSSHVMYEGEIWNYLCYTEEYHVGCHNIHPILEMQIEKEIEQDTANGVQGCFNLMKEDHESKGFSVSGGVSEYSIDLVSGYIRINLKKDIEISSSTGNSRFVDFNEEIISPAYELIQVVRRVVNDESVFCDFEYNAYMMIYPRYHIWRTDYRNNKIYSVTDRVSGEEFKFAVRSCPYPPVT